MTFSLLSPRANSGDRRRLRQFIRFFVEQDLNVAVFSRYSPDRSILSREDWKRMIYPPSPSDLYYSNEATDVIEWLDFGSERIKWVPCFLDDSSHFSSALNIARSAKIVVVGVWL